jgi:YjbE family integral membrane protein
MADLLTTPALVAFLQVVMIDLVLAGDNAVVIGLAAAGLPPRQRKRAILVGVLAATALRILFAGLAMQLLQIIGLLLAGGILLLWVCWKMWRELRAPAAGRADAAGALRDDKIDRDRGSGDPRAGKTLGQAVLQIIVADISMSLDNVLAVAGAAREHPIVLAFGLLLSIGLMGIAANLVARLLQAHRWIAYVGLAIIFYVACDMVYRGARELGSAVRSAPAQLSVTCSWSSRLCSLAAQPIPKHSRIPV